MIKKSPEWTKEIHKDKWLDDGSCFDIIESEGQALEFRVGMVFHGDKVDPVPGIWVCYQNKYLVSKQQGPLLLSPDTFEALIDHIHDMLKRRNNHG